MIGKHTIEVDYRDFLKGMSSSRDTTDGGFSPQTYAVNLTANPGVLNAPALPVDRSTNVTGNIIATCDDPTYLGKAAMFLGEAVTTSYGEFYTMDGSYVMTKQATTGTAKFARGTSDFVAWNDYTTGTTAPNFYATTWAGANGDIVKWNGAATLTESWWVTTLGQTALSANTAWRPMLVYEKYLFIGDKHKLHRITPDGPAVGGSVSNGILVLGVDETITALGIDKGSGYMMIATTRGVDYSANRNSVSNIYLYDGYSATWAKVCQVNGTITAFKNLDDRTIVFIGNKIGYFTGSGVKFLRKINITSGDGSYLVYPHHAVVIENTVYYIEDSKIIAFGEVDKSGKVFYPVHANEPSGSPINLNVLAHIGGGKIAYGYNTNKLYSIDTTDISTITNQIARLYTNKFKFPRPVFIRNAYIEWYDGVANNKEPTKLYYIKEDYTTSQFSSLLNTTGGTICSAETNSIDIKGRMFQFMIVPNYETGVVAGIVRVVISYDIAE